MNATAWLLPLLLPLFAAPLALAVGDRWRPWLLIVAPVPALVLALAGPPGPAPELPWLMLDLRLGLDAPSRVLLVMTAAVWLAAGASATRLATSSPGTAAMWLLTLAGNLGVVLAADVVSFISLYATMTFAAYGLIVYDRSVNARRAGRIYIVMAVAGEALLISGLILAVGAAGDTSMAAVATATADASDLVIGLLVAGFAVKAGVLPLHVWLPLAHPAAPVPASAVLSGAMIKAGLIGWLQVLPIGEAALPDWSATFIVVGLTTAVVGAVIGVLQTRAKVVLAYSSISQMGLITLLVGIGLSTPAAGPVAVAAAVTYALHHGLAKAALFLGVGVLAAAEGVRRRRQVLIGMAVAGLSLAGAPLTSGYVAKSAMKDAVGLLASPWPGRLTLALSVAAVGTTLLMLRLLVVLAGDQLVPRRAGRAPAQQAGPGPTEQATGSASGQATGRAPAQPTGDASGEPTGRAGPPRRTRFDLEVPWFALLFVVVTATWIVPSWMLADLDRPTPSLSSSVDSTWPILVAIALAAVALRHARRAPGAGELDRPMIPPGDLVVVFEAAVPRIARRLGRMRQRVQAARGRVRSVGPAVQRTLQPGAGFTKLDERMTRWRTAGVLLVALIAALTAALLRG